MDDDTNDIGRRLREIRAWREMDLKVVADLAGISFGYLGQIERGEKPVNNRKVLEALAWALRVSPAELSRAPWTRAADPVGAQAHAGLVAIEAALECYELGEDPGGPIRDWPDVAAEVVHLQDLMHVHADYAAQGELVPRLLAELHATYVRSPQHRRDALLGLLHCYSSACWVTKRLGGRGLPLLAARHAQDVANTLGEPQWRGYTAWLRGDAAGQLSRPQQYRRVVAVADELIPHLDDSEVAQAYGMLHLSASLAAAAQHDRTTTDMHLAEATAIADRMPTDVGQFARLWFGTTNVGIWRTSLAAEFGDGAKVAEAARDVHAAAIPSPSRQAEFYCDLGRSLLTESSSRDKGLAMLLHAEELAPQRVRNDVFAREAVADQLRAARRDAGGRELRGLAWRMGVAPTV